MPDKTTKELETPTKINDSKYRQKRQTSSTRERH